MDLLLGTYNPDAPPKRTPGGILWYPYGLDDYGPKRVKKAVKRMVVAGVTPYIIEQFREWALRLPAELPTWIDAAYTARMADWRKCIGGRLPNGNKIDRDTLEAIKPGSFHIKFHPTLFPVPQGVNAAGASWKDHIEAVIGYLADGNTNLIKGERMAEYEIGNMIGIWHGFRPQRIEDEIGTKCPCS